MIVFSEPLFFDWDTGNQDKSVQKHHVLPLECEEAFLNQHHFVIEDIKHSSLENRYILLGQTNNERILFIAFTIRSKRVRIISARDVNKRERKLYEEAFKNSTI